MTALAAPVGRASGAPDHAPSKRDEGEDLIVLDLHGVIVGVRTVLPELIDGVRATWGRVVVPRTAGPRLDDDPATTIHVHAEGGRVVLDDPAGSYLVSADGSPLIALFDRIVHAFNRGLDRANILAIHAGAVDIDGRAVILAGPSGRGKSTLVVELARRGAGFLSDECALVADDDRTILPYPRALHLRPATVALVPGLEVPGDRPTRDLGGGSEVALDPADVANMFGGGLSDGAQLGGVVLLGERLAPDATPQIDPVPAAIAVMELLRGTTSASWDLDRARNRLIAVIGAVPCVILRAGDLAATGDLVTEWARSQP